MKCQSKETTIYRNGKEVAVTIEYPDDTPDNQTDLELATDGLFPQKLLCPGCSDQDVALGRCHGSIIAEHIRSKHPEKTPPTPRGLLCVYPPSKIVELLDDERGVFIGRRAPRGVPTKSVGVKRTLKRSKYGNPFLISKRGFLLGESLALYKTWVKNGYQPLSESELQSVVCNAPVMPETIEEILAQHPDLFNN